MQLNVLDDLAEAMKALDGKKSSRFDVPTEDLRTADTSCPSRTYADHFMLQDNPY